MRTTLRRFSSAKSDILMRRYGIGAAFEIRFAERPASGWPAFLTPIGREAEAHQHRLDRGPAAVEIGKVVSLEYRSESLDVGVVTVYVLPGDKVFICFARWCVRDRRT